MHPNTARRTFLQATATGLLTIGAAFAQTGKRAAGVVIGQPEGAEVGNQILDSGGNAVDAAVAAALVAGVVSVNHCGIGGYGGHMVIAGPDGRVSAIDFNSAAPKATREDMFPLDERGQVRGQIDKYGWLAAGVPGTLAGLQKALDIYGTRKFAALAAPAIGYARDGFVVKAPLAQVIKSHQARLATDPGSARLLLPDGKPPPPGTTLRNPDLAAMLEALASDGSVQSFYRGKIAEQIAGEFREHGGLVTAEDLASYEARLVEPLALFWNGATVHTAPLTAGGLSVVQALHTLAAMRWEALDPDDPATTHKQLEGLRLAWHDRVTLLGDPQMAEVPVQRLVSRQYAESAADRISKAVASGSLITGPSDGRSAGGTIHLSAADSSGMLVALTLTHGESFGAQVAVNGLGLILGHGMSRFDPRPGHPNAPGALKRPLHNMCPTIVTENGRPVAALGATGGRRIPNTMFDVLCQFVGRRRPLSEAAAAPRMHTEGTAQVQLARRWPDPVVEHLRRAGYRVQTGASATLQAVARDKVSEQWTTASG